MTYSIKLRDSLEYDWQRAKLLTAQNPQERQRRCRLLSVVVPCFDEEEVLAETHRQLVLALEGSADALELVYVDDGSQDATLDILRDLQRADRRVRVIALSRNFGQETALVAGLAHAAGDAVAIIDADLQDPPEVILEMLRHWQSGTNVAYGVRAEREGETVFKRWTAGAFYRLLERLADTAIPLDTGNFRLMDRTAVDALLAMPERNRFMRGLVAWTGFRQVPVPFLRAPRAAGKTKYPLRMMLRLALDALLSFSKTPLRLALWLGLAAIALALMGGIYAAVARLLADVWIGSGALLLIAALFLGGIQLVFLGVLGEYMARIYSEVQRRPLYFVQEKLGFTSVDEPSPLELADQARTQHIRRA